MFYNTFSPQINADFSKITTKKNEIKLIISFFLLIKKYNCRFHQHLHKYFWNEYYQLYHCG